MLYFAAFFSPPTLIAMGVSFKRNRSVEVLWALGWIVLGKKSRQAFIALEEGKKSHLAEEQKISCYAA